MGKFFDPDGPFSTAMNQICQLFVLNVLWLVCSLPVFTIGASCSALYAVLFKMRDDKGVKVMRMFFSAFRENFKRGTAVWLVLLVAAIVCALDMAVARQMTGTVKTAFTIIATLGLQLTAMVFTFAFPLVARFENTWRNHLHNALLLALSHVPRLLLSWLPWAAAIVVTMLTPNTLYSMLLIWILIGYAALSYISLWILTPVLKKLEPQEAEEAAEEDI